MRRLWVAFLLASTAAAETPPADAGHEGALLEEEARQIRAIVADLDSTDATKREEAMARLLSIGPGAIPYVVDAIYRKDAKPQLAVLEKLIASGRATLPVELQLSGEDLQAVVRQRQADGSIAKEGRAYLYAKYLDAVDAFRKGEYDAALRKASAIIDLEPRIDFMADLKKLRIACEEQQIQLWLVRTVVSVPQAICRDGEMVTVSLNCTNMSAGNVEMWFGPPAGAGDPAVRERVLKDHAVAEVDIVRRIYQSDGSYTEEHENSVKQHNYYSIPLKAGESRTILKFDLVTGGDATFLVKLSVEAKMRVVQIDGPGALPKERWLRFQPAEVRVFPGDIKKAMENPLQGLLEAIDALDSNSLFLYSELMPEEKRPMAVEAMIKILKDPKWSDGARRTAHNCLASLTGRKFTTDEGWIKWHEAGGTITGTGEKKQ